MPKRLNATGEDRELAPLGHQLVRAGETVDVPDEVDEQFEWPPDWPLADISPAKKRANRAPADEAAN